MKKIYNYENCTVIIHIPDDDRFKERLRRASENFMRKVISSEAERKMANGNGNQSNYFNKKQILD